MKDLAWDDLRYVQAVAETGSVRQSATALKVSHQTVARRIARIEETLGVALFVKSPSGYLATAATEELVRTTAAVESLIGDATRKIRARDLSIAGTVRLATISWLMPQIAAEWAVFRTQHPDISLELTATSTIASFARQEADVALRLTRAPMGDLVGKRLAVSRASIFASKAYLATRAASTPLREHDWIGLAGHWAALRPGQWMDANVPFERVVARSGTPFAVLHLIRGGVGVGLLPCFVGDADPDLVRVSGEIVEALDVPLWLLTHPDLRRSARVRAVMDFFEERLSALADRFAGLAGATAER